MRRVCVSDHVSQQSGHSGQIDCWWRQTGNAESIILRGAVVQLDGECQFCCQKSLTIHKNHMMTSLGTRSHSPKIKYWFLFSCAWLREATLGALKNLRQLLGWGRAVILEHSKAVATGPWKVIGRRMSWKCLAASAPSAAAILHVVGQLRFSSIGFISSCLLVPQLLTLPKRVLFCWIYSDPKLKLRVKKNGSFLNVHILLYVKEPKLTVFFYVPDIMRDNVFRCNCRKSHLHVFGDKSTSLPKYWRVTGGVKHRDRKVTFQVVTLCFCTRFCHMFVKHYLVINWSKWNDSW